MASTRERRFLYTIVSPYAGNIQCSPHNTVLYVVKLQTFLFTFMGIPSPRYNYRTAANNVKVTLAAFLTHWWGADPPFKHMAIILLGFILLNSIQMVANAKILGDTALVYIPMYMYMGLNFIFMHMSVSTIRFERDASEDLWEERKKIPVLQIPD